MLLRYSKKAMLKKATKTKQANGISIETLQDIKVYTIQEQKLNDEVSKSIYGASIYKMIRVESVRGELEKYLSSKLNNKEDNTSYYYLFIDKNKYKIVAVNSEGIDLELM